VITQLEADEYLNPQAIGGDKASPLPNMQARNAVRAGLVAHAVTSGVLALILGLIHVAPLQATPVTPPDHGAIEPGKGYVRILATPWANIVVDDKVRLATPLGRPVELAEGKHRIVFQHDAFAPITRELDLAAGSRDAAQTLVVDFCKDGKPIDAPVTDCGGSP
jgi:eukaryotic-like serine/threonine-protein kinase